ncbi:MAG TPA: hypothetical protein VHE99_10275 [Gammaproteobacteria bacterium]|nr:hypothetical protein [Gammaproteobacteria bacterium]
MSEEKKVSVEQRLYEKFLVENVSKAMANLTKITDVSQREEQRRRIQEIARDASQSKSLEKAIEWLQGLQRIIAEQQAIIDGKPLPPEHKAMSSGLADGIAVKQSLDGLGITFVRGPTQDEDKNLYASSLRKTIENMRNENQSLTDNHSQFLDLEKDRITKLLSSHGTFPSPEKVTQWASVQLKKTLENTPTIGDEELLSEKENIPQDSVRKSNST